MAYLISFIMLMSAVLAQEPAKTKVKQQYYAALFSRGAQWDTSKSPGAQPHFADHGKNLKRLKESGSIAFGARYGEFGMVVFKTGIEQEVRSMFAADSLVLKDILRMELKPFYPFYYGCIEE